MMNTRFPLEPYDSGIEHAPRHVALTRVAQARHGFLDRDPLRHVDFLAHGLCDLIDLSGVPAEDVEADALEDGLALEPVHVLHVAELLDADDDQARLLEDLALGGLLGRLALLDVTLGQREHVAARGLDDRDLGAPLDLAEHDATG
jgi:hypothetical protein